MKRNDFLQLQVDILMECKDHPRKKKLFIRKTQAKLEKMNNEGEITLGQYIEVCELLVQLYK